MPLYLTYVGLASINAAVTKIGLNHGAIEFNRALAYHGSIKAQLSVALGVGILMFWLVEREWKHGHRTAAILSIAIVDGMDAGILVHDVRWLAQHPAGR